MNLNRKLSRPNGFTLVEVMVSTAIFAIAGLLVFLFLNSGMVLYAKNTAVNSAHQQARTAIDQMLASIHAAISIPQLVDTDLQPVPELDDKGQPAAAAGFSFQTFYNGPFPVVKDVKATDTSITLYCPGGYTNLSNTRLNIPSHNIELDIKTATLQSGSNVKFDLGTSVGTAVDIVGTGKEGGAGVTYVITAFITTRVSYAVVGNELRYYPTNDPSSYKVITRNIISSAPFLIPLSSGGGPQNRFVAAVNLSTMEPNVTQRGYAAVNMFINSLIPFRCRLTNSQ